VCARRIFPGCAGGHLLKEGFSARGGFAFTFPQLLRPFASEPSTPLRVRASQFSAAVVAMAMLVHCSIPKIQILEFSQTRSKFKMNFKFHFKMFVCELISTNKIIVVYILSKISSKYPTNISPVITLKLFQNTAQIFH
jgi:hypothetical protein